MKEPQHGHFVVCLNGGQVMPATSLGYAPNGDVIIQRHNDQYVTPKEEIKKVWRIKPERGLPLNVLEEHSKLAAALVSFEQALAAYKIEKGEDALVHREGPVIFGAAAITLSVDSHRNSEDIDYVVSEAFLEWAQTNWTHDTDLAVDLADESIFNLCGKWRERTCPLQGILGTKIRVLHPMDVVMQKLLRRDPVKFEEKDIPDIRVIVNALSPTKETLMGLLTENHLRYLRDPHDFEPNQYDSVYSNTLWLVEEYLPGITVDEVINQAREKHRTRLASLHLVPLPSQNVGDILQIDDLTDVSM